ncbi:MAG: serine/threonine protein kinase [Chiayiivirga sp.]|jgi:serine/threonine-protein kinase|nr:serine/threonine protein kinase [Chiayiivirga sp.]
MKADVFRRLQRLFDEALAHPAETRIEWCQGRVDIDAALRDQLVRLLLRDQNLATASTRHPASLGTEALEHCADVIRLPQQRIPRYEVLEEIGRGGMGRVFRALRQDAVDKNEVAIKMVRRELMQEPVLKRFLVERRLLAALDHPGIARLLDAGEASDGTPFVAMELVRGLPLLRHCAQQSLDLRARLGLFRQVLAAVSHAHRNLIVHRDIKPANVLVTHDGCTKLLDFGIAKPLTAPAQDTATAERYLTPLYAAPELLSGAPANVTLDVYSLGALLYELLSGRPPFEFEGRSAAEVERLLLSTPTRPARPGRRQRPGGGGCPAWRPRPLELAPRTARRSECHRAARPAQGSRAALCQRRATRRRYRTLPAPRTRARIGLACPVPTAEVRVAQPRGGGNLRRCHARHPGGAHAGPGSGTDCTPGTRPSARGTRGAQRLLQGRRPDAAFRRRVQRPPGAGRGEPARGCARCDPTTPAWRTGRRTGRRAHRAGHGRVR